VVIVNTPNFVTVKGLAFQIEAFGFVKIDSVGVAKQVNQPAVEGLQVVLDCAKIIMHLKGCSVASVSLHAVSPLFCFGPQAND
jgi:hypothetical protein